jgi:hypothetical protein
MNIIEQSDYHILYWHNEDKTVLIGEAYAGWTWTIASSGLDKLNEVVGIRAKEVEVYVIIHLTTGAQLMPRDSASLLQMRNLLREDPEHEQLTIYVTEANILRTMLQIVGRLYGLLHLVDKLRFVSTMEKAFQIIDEHKTSNS